jgi:toxin ParE1/3/4
MHTVIRPLAANDIVEQARFVKAVERTFALLAANPRMGRVANFENPWLAGMRVFRVSTFENHLVFYRHLKGTLEMVRLLHGARDLPALFDD